MKHSFIFVCQQGPLELKCMLLAASLRRHLHCDHELIAALPVPESRWGRPADRTRSFLERLGVRSAAISNDIAADYPTGNKVACLGVTTDADVRIFLDSDMLCLTPFAGADELRAPFGAVPADIDSFGATEQIWSLIYAAQKLAVPVERMRASVSGQPMLPYFNAGFIAVERHIDFAPTWARICRAIDADPRIGNKRPWLDQIALPVAVKSLGLDYVALDVRFNYPVHLRRLEPDQLPYFAHYHTPKVIAKSAPLLELVRELAAEHGEIVAAMNCEPNWRRLPGANGANLIGRVAALLNPVRPAAKSRRARQIRRGR